MLKPNLEIFFHVIIWSKHLTPNYFSYCGNITCFPLLDLVATLFSYIFTLFLLLFPV